MKKNKLFILPVALLLIAGCNLASKKDSSSIDQSKIETVYSITYEGETGEVSATATFNYTNEKDDLEQFELDGKSSVTLNGKTMKPKSIPIIGGVYHNVENMNYQEKNTFVYTDNDGKIYTNTVSFKPVTVTTSRNDVDDPDTWYFELSRTMDSTESMWLFLDGDTLVESERIDIQMTDSTENGYYDMATNTIRFTPDLASEFLYTKKIKVQLSFETYHEKIKEVPAAGGKIIVTCNTKEIEIPLIE